MVLNSQRKADTEFGLFRVPLEYLLKLVLATTPTNQCGDHPRSFGGTTQPEKHVNLVWISMS